MVSKTLELRKVITNILNTLNLDVYYENASPEATFPYLTYNLENVDFSNDNRDDIILYIDVWDRNMNSTNVETISDDLEGLFSYKNNPTDLILPTFYIEGRRSIPDEDKEIRRREIRVMIQNYVRRDYV